MFNYKYKMSVVIPVYNCEAHLESCLESLNRQTMNRSDFQIVFVNDGSKDNSGIICKTFAADDENIVYFEKENGGVSSARNKGIELSEGKYIIFLDSDDTLSDNTLETIYNFFEAHYDETDIVTYTINYLSEKGVVTTHKRYDLLGNNGIYDMDPRMLQTTMNVCVKNVPENERVLFDESLSLGEDQFYIFSWMMKKQKFGFVKEAVYTYFRHSNSASSIMNNPYYCFEQYASFLERLIDFAKDENGNPHPVAQALVIYNLGWRITSDMLVSHIDEETEKNQLERLKNILKQIDNRIICNSIYVDTFHIEYLMRLKEEKNDYALNSSVFSAFNEGYLWFSQEHTIVLNSLRIHNNRFCVSGYIKNGVLDYKNIRLSYSDVNNQLHEIPLQDTTFSYYKGRTKTNCFGGFDFKAELSEINSFTFIMEIDGVTIVPKVLFGFKCAINGAKTKAACGEFTFEFNPKTRIFDVCKADAAKLKDYSGYADEAVKADNNRALFYRKAARMLRNKKEIWLYCDRENIFDNAYQQFIHDLTKNDGVERYYVTDGLKDPSKYFNKEHRKHLIKFKSLKHKLLFLNCKKILTSFNSLTIISPFDGMPLKWYSDITDYEVIYLQHGILHANLPLLYSKERSNVDKVVVSSEFEFNNFIKDYNFKEEDLIRSGMPRFDTIDKSVKPKNRILFSPSWRKNLIGDYVNNTRVLFEDKFLASPFFVHINEFLNSDKLAEILEKYDLILDFKNHPIFSPYNHCFKVNNPRINIAQGDIEMQDYALMITDYSSIVFDFVYLQRPILYFVPDYEQFRAGVTHSYYKLDLPLEEGFGEVTETADDLVKCLEKLAENKFMPEKIYDDRMKNFFITKDNHCEKLYEFLK